MLSSMTAFARQAGEGEWGKATWELRTVNHRYLDVHMRLPEDLRVLESDVRERIGQRLKRGKVDCNLRYDGSDRLQSAFTVNRDLVSRLIKSAHEIEPTGSVNPFDILRWPGVLEMPPLDLDSVQQAVLGLLEAALDQLLDSRRREGEKLNAAILSRCATAGVQVQQLRELAPGIVSRMQERFIERAQELTGGLDEGRLEQECALLAQKLDIDEELDRLAAHLEEVERVLAQDEPVGRRLDFLMQEMHREANTIGSKSTHIDSTNASVELKVLIEQMREQVQNIE